MYRLIGSSDKRAFGPDSEEEAMSLPLTGFQLCTWK